MTTPTANFAWAKPVVGADSDTWGTELNALADAIDTALGSGAGGAALNPLSIKLGTGNTLSAYLEGSLTLTDQSGAALALTIGGTPYYRKIGTMVFVSSFYVQYPATANGSNAAIGPLPFTPKDANTKIFGVLNDQAGGSTAFEMSVAGATTNISVLGLTGTAQTNANLTTRVLLFPSFCYPTA